jgi:hypothetical protein
MIFKFNFCVYNLGERVKKFEVILWWHLLKQIIQNTVYKTTTKEINFKESAGCEDFAEIQKSLPS